MYARVTKSYLTLCDPVDCSPPGSSVHFPGKNTGVGGHSLLHTAVGQVKNRSVSGGAGRGRGKAEGLGGGAGRSGKMKCHVLLPVLPPTPFTWGSKWLSTELPTAGPQAAASRPLSNQSLCPKHSLSNPLWGPLLQWQWGGPFRAIDKPPGSLLLMEKETLCFSSVLAPLNLMLVPRVLGFRGWLSS